MPLRERFQAAGRWLPLALLLGVLVLATAVRLHRIGAMSLWLDEAYSYARGALPPAESIDASIKKGHVPTYFLFMHYWLALGDDEATLRLPSAIFGVLTVAGAYVLGRVLAGARVGVIAALLVALSPVQVRYAQEVRMYTMFTFAAAIALSGLVWLLVHPEQAAVPLWRAAAWRDGSAGRARRAAWIAYVAGTVAMLYLHNTAVFFVASCSLAALVLIAANRDNRLIAIANWTLANSAVLAAWSFWISTLLMQARRVAHDFWPAYPKARQIIETFSDLYLYGAHQHAWAVALFVALFGLGLFALRKQPRLAAALSVLALSPPLLVLLVSLIKPMFIMRIMLWAPIPWFAVVACGVFALRWRAAPYLLAALVLLAGYQSLAHHFQTFRKPRWHQVALMIGESYGARTRVLTAGSQERTVLEYYFRRRSGPVRPFPTSKINLRRLAKQVRGADIVWILDYKKGKRFATRRALPELAKNGTIVMNKAFGALRVFRFDMRRKQAPQPAPPRLQPPSGPLAVPIPISAPPLEP